MIESATAGILLGLVFFAGLWWTILKGVTAYNPALWFMGSLWLWISVVLAGFYLVSQGDWRRLGMCLLGFQLARVWVGREVRRAP